MSNDQMTTVLDYVYKCPSCEWEGRVGEMKSDFAEQFQEQVELYCPVCGVNWNKMSERYEPE